MEFIYSSDEDPPIAYDDYRHTPFTNYSAVGRLWKEHFQRSPSSRNPEVTRAFHMRCSLHQFMYPELTRAEVVAKLVKEVSKAQKELEEENVPQYKRSVKPLKMINTNELFKKSIKNMITQEKVKMKSSTDVLCALNDKTNKKCDGNKVKSNSTHSVKHNENKCKNQLTQVKNKKIESNQFSIKYHKINCEFNNITKSHFENKTVKDNSKSMKICKTSNTEIKKPNVKNMKFETDSQTERQNKHPCDNKVVTKQPSQITSMAIKQQKNKCIDSTTKLVKVKAELDVLKTKDRSGKTSFKKYKPLVLEKKSVSLPNPLKNTTKRNKKNMAAVNSSQYKSKKVLILNIINNLEEKNINTPILKTE